ncbi:MAG: putative esterase [Streptosporangiaceae bacterium]|nr:putative esterase [Streptosporangiaceae bacterium]
MGLTSAGFLVVLFVLVAITAAGTVWWWPKLAGKGVVPILGRIGVLALTQLTALVAVLALVNDHYVFYSGWDDLLGTNAGVAGIKHVQARSGSVRVAITTAPIKRMNLHRGHQDPARDGALEEFRFQGPTTGLRSDTFVLLPPEYFQSPFASRRFPAVIVMTGYPGNPAALVHAMHFPELVAQGVKSGKVQPTIWIMMRPTVAPPRDTECTDVPAGPQAESFFAQDVPTAVAAHYRVANGRSGWGFMGDSTGGYCAVKMAMRHPDRFSAAASLSGYYKSLQDLTTGDLYGGSKAVRQENDLLWREQHLPAPNVSILVESCRTGEKTFPQAQQFVAQAKAPMQVHSLFLDSGGHNFRTFRRMVPATLEWLSARLKAE